MSNLPELETVIAPDPVDEEQLVAQSKNVLLFDDIYFAGLEAEFILEKEDEHLQEIVQPLMTVLSNAA